MVESRSRSCDKHPSIHFDFGDYDDPQRGFINGTYYAIWADNSAALHVPQTKGFKNYALAKIKVEDFGRTHTIEKVINLTRDPNGDKLFGDYTLCRRVSGNWIRRTTMT